MPDTIVPRSCIVSAITWDIDREVREALAARAAEAFPVSVTIRLLLRPNSTRLVPRHQ